MTDSANGIQIASSLIQKLANGKSIFETELNEVMNFWDSQSFPH